MALKLRTLAAFALTALLAGWPGFASATPSWRDQLGLDRAHELSTGAGVVVGVVDTGVARFSDAVLPGADFPDLGAEAPDPHGHGTAMARLVLEVAPNATVLPARLNGGPADVNAALRWVVDEGAGVVNLSLGGTPGSSVYDEGLRYAREHDVVVVAAAGNASVDSRVTSPADRDGVLAVSAVDEHGEFRPDVSVEGPEIFLAAPGVDVAAGQDVPRRGTSQAAAVVSGTVALVRARFPELSATEVTDRLARTATDAGAPGRDPRFGFGLVNPRAALAGEPASHLGCLVLSCAVALGVLVAGCTMWQRRARQIVQQSHDSP
ncbi:S8 family serine peptidase [Lentzea aerocolonigenes]|uniref:S8 family serine peptidase n=1 Tax=Lentzea aerocolonigenes TaxID=68170 RepID=UPI0006962C95|nr:S8 family serine peptidase [Lentzea aerocolonigenes]